MAGIITWAFPLWENFFYFIIIANRSNKFNSLNKSVRMKVVKIKEIVLCSSDEKTFSSPYCGKSTGKTLYSVGWLKLDFDLSIFRLKITKIFCKKKFLAGLSLQFYLRKRLWHIWNSSDGCFCMFRLVAIRDSDIMIVLFSYFVWHSLYLSFFRRFNENIFLEIYKKSLEKCIFGYYVQLLFPTFSSK